MALYGKNNVVETVTREYIVPKRILKVFGNVENEEKILEDKERIVRLGYDDTFVFTTTAEEKAGVLIDFGAEICGGACIGIYYVNASDAKLRLSFGESANEALADLGYKNSCNDHSPRDFVVDAQSFSVNNWGQTGFRFLYLQLLTEGSVCFDFIKAVAQYKPYEYVGSFECDDQRLNDVYNVSARTCHLCIQDQLWDGIKRDRLVWIGDLAPELKTIKYVFGDIKEVEEALLNTASVLDFKDTWINTLPTYSLWWIINLEEWCFYKGDNSLIISNKENVSAMIEQIIRNVDENGVFLKDDFIDWPSKDTESAKEGIKALSKMFFDAAKKICDILSLTELSEKCEEYANSLAKFKCSSHGYKQIASLLLLNNMEDDECHKVLSRDGAKGLSTFMSYYIFSALGKVLDEGDVLEIVKEYYGKMLDLGATSFWEDFDIEWAENACRIDEISTEGKSDVHGDNGRFCYIGFRHSLCHGWASGPVPFITEYVLGVNVLTPSCDSIKLTPHLANLDYAKGSIATPHGKVEIYHKKDKNGKIITEVKAPESVKVIF